MQRVIGMNFPKAYKVAVRITVVLMAIALSFWLGLLYAKCGSLSKYYTSESRFSQIKSMLLSYYADHGSFPPVKYRKTPDGPEHSWRVLLVSEYSGVSSQYDYSKAWNNPENIEALKNAPKYFSTNDSNIANYLTIDKEDEWPFSTNKDGSRHSKPLESLLVVEGINRFLIIENPDSNIHWMEPKN